MKLKSNAKLNLTLDVHAKLKNGLHDIQSNVSLLNLHDEIYVNKSKFKDKIRFYGKFSEHVRTKNNSIIHTLKILRKHKLINNFYNIKVKKNIPVFAGLGGGTSNAYFLAKHLTRNKVLKKKIEKDIIKKVGTDYSLFYFKKSYQKNLNILKRYKSNFNFYFLLVYPFIKCKTSSIYKSLKKVNKFRSQNFSRIKKKEIFIKKVSEEKNYLQDVVNEKYPKINKILKEIRSQKGCSFSRVTGSGSASYGLFKSQKNAKEALKNIRKSFPKYWHVVTKTL